MPSLIVFRYRFTRRVADLFVSQQADSKCDRESVESVGGWKFSSEVIADALFIRSSLRVSREYLRSRRG